MGMRQMAGVEDLDFSIFQGKSVDEITAMFDDMPADLLEGVSDVLIELGILPDGYNYMIQKISDATITEINSDTDDLFMNEVKGFMSTLNQLADAVGTDRSDMIKAAAKIFESEKSVFNKNDSKAPQDNSS